ncbi:MAG TPA: HEPN domain-containing protein [Chitinophagaceae bacterium]|nr:HEPN domain-containing protein [Chitinophagaceae bacterium]
MIVYIPIRGPEISDLDDEYERFLEEFNNFTETNEIKKLLDQDPNHESIKQIKFSIIYSSKDTNQENLEIKKIDEKYFIKQYIEEFLKIEVAHEKNIYDKNSDYARISLGFIIRKLSFIVHLTYSTQVDFLAGAIFSSDNKYLGKTETFLSFLNNAYEHALKIEWPKLESLKLQNTIAWFYTNNIHTDGNSKNKLHRAINAFSYQFSKLLENNTSILFWTMLGIEALLAEGNNNIINQIKVKSSLILGQPTDYKKKLDKLYNYRSRFVHGDIDFPAKFSNDYDNFEEEYFDYLHFATSILLALIRYLIVNNKNEFQFEYKLVK